jgi:hypothetical protein
VRPFPNFVLIALAAGELGGTAPARESNDLVQMEFLDGQFGLYAEFGGRPAVKQR